MIESPASPLKPADGKQARARRRFLGEMLCEQGVISRQQLNEVLEVG